MMAEGTGWVAVAIWLYLLLARGNFWRIRGFKRCETQPLQRSVVVIIPARDEAETIGEAVQSLLSQDYSGTLHVIVVDDHSGDGTAQIAMQAAGADRRLSIIPADPLPPGWSGKLWALNCGLPRAILANPDYFLFTDADIVHSRRSVGSLVHQAESGPYDMVSLMVKLRCRSFAERALVPAFLFFFLKLYPPNWTANRAMTTAGAAGGSILVRPEALRRAGGLERIRGELIDDCALARQVKKVGPIWMGVTAETHSIREYRNFSEVGRMISRSAFTQLRYSALLLVGAALGLMLTYLTAPILAIWGPSESARWLGIAAWILMSAGFIPTVLFYDQPAPWAVALPLIALFYLAATVHSAFAYWTGRGGFWKGRPQAKV